jgi:hypothetical protein
MIFFFLIAALVLAYLLYRAFPYTTLAILLSIGIVAWSAFAKNQQPGDTMTTILAGLIVVAFVADIVLRLVRPFRR